ncbi:MAG: peptide chain release factor N(5)-glutamine methyltransferase [Gemmatimonadaceae bacterium]|jgi:release factor glutamine methyltransferase
MRQAMRAGELVAELEAVLRNAHIEQARREAGDMIAAIVDGPRFWAAQHRDEIVAPLVVERARAAALRRAGGAPFAYAVGRAAFRHLTLEVDERVLIPRQETERLVDEVLACVSSGAVADIGTGSGAIAIALASEGHYERVIATDVSTAALQVAAENVRRCSAALRCPVELRAGSLLTPLFGSRMDAIVANPPYIAHTEARELPASVRDWEPPTALYSAEGGLRDTARLIRQAPDVLRPGGLLAIEVDARRGSQVAAMARAEPRFRDVIVRPDLAGRDRILLATRVDE